MFNDAKNSSAPFLKIKVVNNTSNYLIFPAISNETKKYEAISP
jgi:hypothetical protein